MKKTIKVCDHCEEEFIAETNGSRCPKKRCVDYRRLKKVKTHKEFESLSPGQIGALGELMVSCDLIKKGYEVFRALSQSCSCDLVALKNEKCVRIEVRYSNTIYIPTGKGMVNKKHRADVLAIVTGKEITYSKSL